MDDRQFTQRALDCQRKLYRVALSMLRCDADAADAIQEAVFKGWLHRGALRDGERFARVTPSEFASLTDEVLSPAPDAPRELPTKVLYASSTL